MQIKEFFDKETSTLTYIVYDEWTKDTVIIDPVLDFDQASGRVHSGSVNSYIAFLKENSLKLHYVLETHAHADHLSGSQVLKNYDRGLQIVISAGIAEVQKTFCGIFNFKELLTEAFDRLLQPYDTIIAGSLKVKALPTPGHTPACMSFLIADSVFTGDALFMPDSGTGRCDFPGGNATALYESITRELYSLSEFTKVYVGHDYQPGGRALAFSSTIKDQKLSNIHLKSSTSKEDFVEFRTNRDLKLNAPKLLFPSLQVNICAGELPKPEDNGTRYLKIPLQTL